MLLAAAGSGPASCTRAAPWDPQPGRYSSTRPGCHSWREELAPCAPLGSKARGDTAGSAWALQKDSLPEQHPNPAQTGPARRRTDLTPLRTLDLPDSHVPCGTAG